MKSFSCLLVICLIIFALISDYAGLEAAKIFNRNGNGNGNGLIYCKWSTRKTCSKTSKFCVKLTVGTAPNAVITCKQYKNECAFMMDNCLQQTAYGISGAQTTTSDCQGLTVGQIQTCT